MTWKLAKHQKGTKWNPSDFKRYEANYAENVTLVVEGNESQRGWYWLYRIEQTINDNVYSTTPSLTGSNDDFHKLHTPDDLDKSKELCLKMADELKLK